MYVGKFHRRNDKGHPFIPTIAGDSVLLSMKASTPRFAGIGLRLVESVLRATPLPRLLSRLVVERKLSAIDFAAEGDPAPYYMPPHYQRKHRP
ncbi:MAG TPA: hypothetical protein VF706_03290 [Solirubrobacteraceae bacterium]